MSLLNEETRRKLRELNLSEMVDAIDINLKTLAMPRSY